jgi:hypothetical protein
MTPYHGKAKAFFFTADGDVYSDELVCSGQLLLDPGGQPCPYSHDGRIPEPQPLDPAAPDYGPEKGRPGDLCPPCARQQFADLGHWKGYRGQHYSEDLRPLRLFKCSQWLWLVVRGLRNDDPTRIRHGDPGEQG